MQMITTNPKVSCKSKKARRSIQLLGMANPCGMCPHSQYVVSGVLVMAIVMCPPSSCFGLLPSSIKAPNHGRQERWSWHKGRVKDKEWRRAAGHCVVAGLQLVGILPARSIYVFQSSTTPQFCPSTTFLSSHVFWSFPFSFYFCHWFHIHNFSQGERSSIIANLCATNIIL